MRVRISPTIRDEWQTRCIGDVIPALADYAGEPAVDVTPETAQEIAADCRHYIDPHAVDATSGERRAYRSLLRQIEP